MGSPAALGALILVECLPTITLVLKQMLELLRTHTNGRALGDMSDPITPSLNSKLMLERRACNVKASRRSLLSGNEMV